MAEEQVGRQLRGKVDGCGAVGAADDADGRSFFNGKAGHDGPGKGDEDAQLCPGPYEEHLWV